MAHYAKVVKGIVQKVIVADSDFFDTFIDNGPGEWIQTSYNTIGGEHLLDGTPLRNNYAAPGDTYDTVRDAFYAPKPYPSWTLNETTCFWEPPVEHPHDERRLAWDEDTQTWIEVTL